MITKCPHEGKVLDIYGYSLELYQYCTENENSIAEQAVIDQFNQLGVDLDEHILGPAMKGVKILTGDGRKASIIHTDLGLQMRIEEIAASGIGWEDW